MFLGCGKEARALSASTPIHLFSDVMNYEFKTKSEETRTLTAVELGKPVGIHRAKVRQRISLALLLGDLVAIVLAFVFAGILRANEDAFSVSRDFLFVLTPLSVLFSIYNNAYHPDLSENYLASVRRGLSSLAMAVVTLALIMFFLKVSASYSRAVFAAGCALAGLLICISRILVVWRWKSGTVDGLYAHLSILDGWTGDHASLTGAVDAAAAGIVADLTDSAAVARLGEIAEGMDRITVYCSPAKRLAWAELLRTVDVPSEIIAPELDELGVLALRRDVGGYTALLLNSGHLSWNQRVAKRLFDLSLGTLLSVLCIPVFIAVAVAIKIDSPGPVFFRQVRIGLGNRAFRIWKFRTMRTEMTDFDGSVSTARGDSRITPLGALLRRTSLDELPQLINVLGGSMSLVGPRPHATGSRAEEVLFWDIDRRYWYRHTVKPGMTGLAQIRGYRGSTLVKSDLVNRLHADLEYVAKWTLLGDVRILLQTLVVLIHRNAF